MNVIKANGMRQAFNEAKLRRSMQKAMVDTGRAVNRSAVNRAARTVKAKHKAKGTITTREIKAVAFKNLGKQARTAWQRFDRKYKRARARRATARRPAMRRRASARRRR